MEMEKRNARESTINLTKVEEHCIIFSQKSCNLMKTWETLAVAERFEEISFITFAVIDT